MRLSRSSCLGPAAVLLVDPVNDVPQGVRIQCRGLFRRQIVLCDALLYLREYPADPGLKLRLVPLRTLPPDKGVPVGGRLDLRAVYVLHVEADLSGRHQLHHHLDEQAVDSILQALAPEAVDRAERRRLSSAQPHVVEVPVQEFRYPAAGIDVVHVGIEDDLQKGARMIGRGTASLVRPEHIVQIQSVNYAVYETYR